MKKAIYLIKLFIYELWHWYQFIFGLIPGKIGVVIRFILYFPFFKKIGYKTQIREMTFFWDPHKISLGNNVSVNRMTEINGEGSIEIGDNTRIGPYVFITSTNHIFNNKSLEITKQGHKKGKVIIEEDCWIGANVTILSDVRIGKGSIIGAGSIVTKDVLPYCVYAGNPAKIIKKR